jgi:hypothetical protein
MEHWKIVLALAVLALPLTYCEVKRIEIENATEVACIEKRGEWVRGNCTFQ